MADEIEDFRKLSEAAISLDKTLREIDIDEVSLPSLNKALSDQDLEKAQRVLSSLNIDNELRVIYEKSIFLPSIEDEQGKIKSLEWFENCAAVKAPKLAHQCAITLANWYHKQTDNAKTLEWAMRAHELASKTSLADKDYWRLHYLSSEMLVVAFVIDRDVSRTIEASGRYIESAEKSGLKIDAYHLINNFAHVARLELGPKAAISVLSVVEDRLESLNPSEQEIMFYTLGKNYSYAGDLEASLRYYRRLENVVSRPDIMAAYSANMALVLAKIGQYSEALAYAQKAEELFGANLENEFGINILKAKKLIAVAQGELADAIVLDSEMDILDELLDEKALSANRNRLSRSLKITNEKIERERDKLQFETQLAAQKTRARNIQLFLAFVAMSFLTGFLIHIIRSYRTEQRLNAEIRLKNDELKIANITLSETNVDLKNTSAKLKVALRQAMAGQDAKQKFIGVVGHELRTPLNPIINLSEVLEKRAGDSQDRALLKAIKNAGKRLHVIVENMLAISSVDKDSAIYIEMVDVVEEAKLIIEDFLPVMNDRNEVLKPKGQFLSVNMYKHPDLKADQVGNKIIFRTIIRNLFDNAIKFTEHGTIVVRLQPLTKGPGFQFEIKDTGQGIDPEKTASLLRPFEQAEMGLGRSHEGAGLGLSVVQKYCEQLGAKMSINSTVGKGTCITVDFPEPVHESKTGQLLKVA